VVEELNELVKNSFEENSLAFDVLGEYQKANIENIRYQEFNHSDTFSRTMQGTLDLEKAARVSNFFFVSK
jgi:hypothetical protein